MIIPSKQIMITCRLKVVGDFATSVLGIKMGELALGVMLNKIACDLVVCGTLPLYLNVLCRYRVAEVEWIQDIMPPEGTKEREDVSTL